jgi:hypothetical protein
MAGEAMCRKCSILETVKKVPRPILKSAKPTALTRFKHLKQQHQPLNYSLKTINMLQIKAALREV